VWWYFISTGARISIRKSLCLLLSKFVNETKSSKDKCLCNRTSLFHSFLGMAYRNLMKAIKTKVMYNTKVNKKQLFQKYRLQSNVICWPGLEVFFYSISCVSSNNADNQKVFYNTNKRSSLFCDVHCPCVVANFQVSWIVSCITCREASWCPVHGCFFRVFWDYRETQNSCCICCI